MGRRQLEPYQKLLFDHASAGPMHLVQNTLLCEHRRRSPDLTGMLPEKSSLSNFCMGFVRVALACEQQNGTIATTNSESMTRRLTIKKPLLEWHHRDNKNKRRPTCWK